MKRYKCIGDSAFCIALDEKGTWVKYSDYIKEAVKFKTRLRYILRDIKDDAIRQRIIKALGEDCEEVQL
ncbi:hypothetical protein UFOVP1361_45 [uncultured Caudovirales phage]|uniref:Uncharacterized protein n=1 Tax=uncultured Caudovirales phage TaxID=2100421 RepID=A0A6J5S2X7_9CAUD|nr:hypothetical protein UFOVP1361_45 [uncultured Caudovirales phage]